MSDDEFRERIKELARRNQAKGIFQCGDVNGEFQSLKRSFVSVASPDREGMINNALPTIINRASSALRGRMQHSMCPSEFIWRLLLGKDIPPLESSNPGQHKKLFTLKDEGGNKLAVLTTAGWEVHATPAESGRRSEFLALYNEAWDAARFGWGRPTRGDGWAEKEEGIAPLPCGAMPNLAANNITTVNASELQPQQEQAASQVASRYEANLHEVS